MEKSNESNDVSPTHSCIGDNYEGVAPNSCLPWLMVSNTLSVLYNVQYTLVLIANLTQVSGPKGHIDVLIKINNAGYIATLLHSYSRPNLTMDGQTGGRTDRPTDTPTDTSSHGVDTRQ